jgi:hypothetical protein
MMDSVLRMPGDHCMWCVEPSDVPCQLGCRKPPYRDSFDQWKMEATGVPKPHEMPDLSATPVSAADGEPLFRSPQDEDHGTPNTGDERVALNQTRCSGCTEAVRDEEPLRFRSGVLWHEACLAAPSPQDEDHEPAVRALMKRWIDQANAERYIGGPNTSPMVEPEEYDIDDPPEGMEEQARRDVECVVAALSPSRVGSVAVEDVEKALLALDEAWRDYWHSAVAGYGSTNRLRDQLNETRDRLLAEFSRSSTDRPEQPEPDVLGGQPPAEPGKPGNG